MPLLGLILQAMLISFVNTLRGRIFDLRSQLLQQQERKAEARSDESAGPERSEVESVRDSLEGVPKWDEVNGNADAKEVRASVRLP